MNNKWSVGVVWASLALVAHAQEIPFHTQAVQILSNNQLICVNAQDLDQDNRGVQCSYYTMVSQRTSWPWLNQAIDAHLKQAMPVLTVAHVPPPSDFDAQKDWRMERHYHVDDIVLYRGLVTIKYGGWDYDNGTPHGNPYERVEVWDERRRTVVGLDELIALEHHAAVLAVLQRHNEGDGEMGLWLDGWPHDMVLSSQYSVTAQGLTFHYGLYELGTYLLGTPALTVPWHELKPYLRKPWQKQLLP